MIRRAMIRAPWRQALALLPFLFLAGAHAQPVPDAAALLKRAGADGLAAEVVREQRPALMRLLRDQLATPEEAATITDLLLIPKLRARLPELDARLMAAASQAAQAAHGRPVAVPALRARLRREARAWGQDAGQQVFMRWVVLPRFGVAPEGAQP